MCEKSYNNKLTLFPERWFRVHETTGFEENLSICEAKQLRRGATPSTIIIYYIEITTFNNNNFRNIFKKCRKSPKSTPHSYQHMLGLLVFRLFVRVLHMGLGREASVIELLH